MKVNRRPAFPISRPTPGFSISALTEAIPERKKRMEMMVRKQKAESSAVTNTKPRTKKVSRERKAGMKVAKDPSAGWEGSRGEAEEG